MRLPRPALAALLAGLAGAGAARAQDLSPRAYLVTPVGSNGLTIGDIFNDGNLRFDGTVPITDSTGRLHMPNATYVRSLSFLGRSANVAATLAYGKGTFRGTVAQAEIEAPRSGMFDSVFRFSVNLKGGPALGVTEFARWRQKTLVGASLKVVAPTGQYDPSKLLNLGANRWAFKPELGLSQRWGHWVLDGYGAVWLFTRNPEFFSRNAYVPGVQSQTQDPIWAFETHLSREFKPRLWVSFDGNFWYGGRTSLNGKENPATLQKGSRVGVTASFPLTRRQSVKVAYADGAYVRFGGDYRILSAAWQYAWVSKPRPR